MFSVRAHICRSHDTANLLHGVEIRAEAAVHGENLLINDGSNGQAVEAVRESLPELDVVATLALVVEAVDAVDGSALVVSAKDKEVLWILDLVRKEQADGLERLLSTIDIVTQEEVVGLGREPAVLEEAEQVVVLAVNVTTDLRGRICRQQMVKADIDN